MTLDEIQKDYAAHCAKLGDMIVHIDRLESQVDDLLIQIQKLEAKARVIREKEAERI